MHIGIIISLYAMIILTLNLVLGYAGQLNLAHAGFVGIGSYTSALLMRNYDLNFFLVMGAGMIMAAAAAAAVGSIISKLRGDYYALASLAFTAIVYGIFMNWTELTRGPLGIPGIANPVVFGNKISPGEEYFLFFLAASGIIYLICKFITNSSFGRVLKGIREDQEATEMIGYNVFAYKLIIFMISAALAGAVGAIYGSYISFIDPASFKTMASVDYFVIAVIGGLASHKGAIVGAIVFVLILEALRFAGFPPEITGQLRMVAYGLAVALLMVYKPTGIYGEFRL